MSERPSPQVHNFGHQDINFYHQLGIAFEANVSSLFTEPLKILALHGYFIENIEPLARLSKLVDSVEPYVRVFYVLGTPYIDL